VLKAIRELVNTPPLAILIDYADGTRGAALRFGGAGFCAACRLKGEQTPRSTSSYGGPWGSCGLFPALAHAIQKFFVTKMPPYPAERTLLVGGTVDAAMHSHQQGGVPIPTPHLKFGYPTVDWSASARRVVPGSNFRQTRRRPLAYGENLARGSEDGCLTCRTSTTPRRAEKSIDGRRMERQAMGVDLAFATVLPR